jgi:hypothetical protein
MIHSRLSGIAPTARSRNDLIKPAVFGALSQGLNDPNIKGLLELRHKVVAHAADNRPRDLAYASLNHVLAAQRILVKIAHTIGETILFESGAGGLPTPQFC